MVSPRESEPSKLAESTTSYLPFCLLFFLPSFFPSSGRWYDTICTRRCMTRQDTPRTSLLPPGKQKNIEAWDAHTKINAHLPAEKSRPSGTGERVEDRLSSIGSLVRFPRQGLAEHLYPQVAAGARQHSNRHSIGSIQVASDQATFGPPTANQPVGPTQYK